MTTADGAPASNGVGIPAPGEFVDGRFVVEHTVGAGGMGVVLAARDGLTGEPRAIKVMLPDAAKNEDAVSRFLQEAKACRLLKSEHIAQIFHVGALPNGSPFLVMELLAGRDLGAVLAEQKRLPIETAVDLVLQACAAIAEAHQQGIVHRDLKPANFFVSERDGRPHLKVLDFGISKITNPDEHERVKTNTSFSFGTPVYMSPEQIRSTKNVDARTDVWALGVILHELIAGSLPFEGETLPALYAAITADAPTPLRARRPDVPPGLELLILRCLEKDPNRRIQTVAELARSLLPFASADGRGVVAGIDDLVASGKHRTIALSPALSPSAALPVNTVAPWDTSYPATSPSSRKLAVVGVLLAIALGVAGVIALASGDDAKETTAAPAASSAPIVVPAEAPAPTPSVAPPPPAPASASATPRDSKPTKHATPTGGSRIDPLRDRR